MGWVERFNAEENEEGYLMIGVRPEEYKDGLGSDITLNRRDMRSKFGYTTLNEIFKSPFTLGKLDIFYWDVASLKRGKRKGQAIASQQLITGVQTASLRYDPNFQ